MKPENDYQHLVRTLVSRRIVAYFPGLADLVGGVKSAVLLSQLMYLDGQRENPGTWFPVSVAKLQEMTGLSTKEQRTARKPLVEKNLIVYEKRGMPARYHYRISVDNLAALSGGQLELPEIGSPVCPVGTHKSVPTGLTSVSQPASHECPDGPHIIKKNLKDSGGKKKKGGKKTPPPPGVVIYRRVAKRFPNKAIWSEIDRIVGAEFSSLLKWGHNVRKWIGFGWNPTNINGMLETFQVGFAKKIAGSSTRAKGYDPAADVDSFKRKKGMR